MFRFGCYVIISQLRGYVKSSAEHGAQFIQQSLEQIGDSLVDLFAGQAAVVGTEGQVEGHGLLALGHALAAVDVEQSNALQQALGALLDGGLQLTHGDSLLAHHSDDE